VCRFKLATNGRGLLLLAKVSKLIALRHANSSKPMLADVAAAAQQLSSSVRIDNFVNGY